jgi:hypothetical protein
MVPPVFVPVTTVRYRLRGPKHAEFSSVRALGVLAPVSEYERLGNFRAETRSVRVAVSVTAILRRDPTSHGQGAFFSEHPTSCCRALEQQL